MRTVHRLAEYRASLDGLRARGEQVGLVTTMGALHAGHVSLLRRAAEECDVVAATIFVNPTQFGDPTDLAAYPRDLHHDLEVCRDAGATLVLVPEVEEMYPRWPQPMGTVVSVGPMASMLEGMSRPGHFDAVATVVAKLLCLTGPCRAYFGEKDFQQLAVVRAMAEDLSIPVDVVGCATVREPDGLAMSSRNVRLTPSERAAAPVLVQALRAGCRAAASGATQPLEVVRAAAQVVESQPLATLDYAAVVECSDLSVPRTLTGRRAGELRLLISAQLGPVRLIDNCDPFEPPPTTVPRAGEPQARWRQAGAEPARSDP